VAAYRIIRAELAAFSQDLAEKPEIVVLSKMDLQPEESVLKSLADDSDKEVCPISAVTGSGVKDLLREIARRLFSEPEW
jgi:GTP-binding protein